MTTKHTPGPWRQVGQYGDVFGSENVAVCRMHRDAAINTDRPTWDEGAANARLIAAAPALLAALESMMYVFEPADEPDELPDWLVLARAAIKAAKGE